MVVAARTGLGTINHTLLTVEAARAAGLTVAGVVLTPWPDEPAPIEQSNRATIERLAGVPVSGLPPTEPGSPRRRPERRCPLDDWLAAYARRRRHELPMATEETQADEPPRGRPARG